MASKLQLDQQRIQSCLQVIQQLYQDYTPDEIVEAFAINRQEIQAREQRQQLENQLAELQEKVDKLDE